MDLDLNIFSSYMSSSSFIQDNNLVINCYYRFSILCGSCCLGWWSGEIELKPGGGEVGGHMGATERCVGAAGPVWPVWGPRPVGGSPEEGRL